MQEVGKVTHYYGKIGVAIIKLSESLRVGDKIRVVGKHAEFEQPVASLEADHQAVEEAKRGDVIGMKVVEKANEGAAVYKLEA